MVSGKPVLSASVRGMAAFVLRSGDLGGGGGSPARHRAAEGTRGHQRLQKARPPGYQAETPVRWTVEDPAFTFELRGRIDGVLAGDGGLLIEEIKTVRRRWQGEPDPLHWAQAKIYAFIYAREHGFGAADVRVTYLELESGETAEFQERCPIGALEAFFQRVVHEYLDWLRAHQERCAGRDRSIEALAFPFAGYRAGQRSLAVAVYRAIQSQGRLFAEAPTGIGKTMSVLFPAIKAMAGGRVEKIFYATAKTVGRIVAEEALEALCAAGLSLRSVTLTARDKICFNDGAPCDLSACPFAKGFYDRIKPALRESLAGRIFSRSEIEGLARRHQVCPFELSVEMSQWADAVICDYNYIFDPSASLKRCFDGEKHGYAILVDEAHNLPDRAREMYSAALERNELVQLKRSIQADLPELAKALSRIASKLKSLPREDGWTARGSALVSAAVPGKIGLAVEQFLNEAERWLAQEQPSAFRPGILDVYFKALAFARVLGVCDQRYAVIYETGAERLRLFCLDPSALLRSALHRTGAAVFFSATLRPLPFFRQSCGGEPPDPLVQLRSPFPPENLCVLVHDQISTRFNDRAGTCGAVAASIAAAVQARAGNYLVYLPSHAYLAEVLARFRQACPDAELAVQTTGMTEAERGAFLEKFRAGPDRTLVGFAVLGGIFGEGIDLAGERLVGVMVAGVGLPQLCLERDLIKEKCADSGARGFDLAYTFPGMNRVLQAVGRVIRSETDRGIVLLIDERYRHPLYRSLFPDWWTPQRVRSAPEIAAQARAFWSRAPG